MKFPCSHNSQAYFCATGFYTPMSVSAAVGECQCEGFPVPAALALNPLWELSLSKLCCPWNGLMRPVQCVRIKIERFEINLGKHEKIMGINGGLFACTFGGILGIIVDLIWSFVSFFSVSHHTRRCLGTCPAIGYSTCLSMERPTAVFPGTALHSGTASAVSRRLCTRPWVPRQWISAGPCVTTPCGICSSGSRDRPTPGSQDSTTTCPAPRP